MGEQIAGGRLASSPQVTDGVSHLGPDDGSDHQVQAQSAILLSVTAPLGGAALSDCANGLRQRVALLALFETRLARSPKRRVLEQSSMNKVRSTFPTSWRATAS